MITVLIVDDHPVMRAGLRHVLSAVPDLEVIDDCKDGLAALEHPRLAEVDVILLDISMPGLDGVEVLELLAERQHAPRVLVLTSIAEDDRIVRAIEAGAGGVLFKDAGAPAIAEGVREVAAGRTVLASRAADSLIRERRPREPGVRLTQREREILGLVAQGKSNAAIGRALYISETTVKTHLQHAYTKLDASDRAHAITLAREQGLL